MNNFINFSKKLKRSGLERMVVSSSHRAVPNIEQYISVNRYPVLPKIVVYSAATNSDSFLNTIFPFFSVVNPGLTAETDEVIAHRISDELTRVSKDHLENEDTSRFGFLLKGFPYNTTQALLLDRYLNGVNLALHVRTANESQDYLDSIKPLLNYYDERGTLLELTHTPEYTNKEITTAMEQIRIKIKRSA